MTTPPLSIVHVAATTNGAPWMLELMREQRRRGHHVRAIIPPGPGTIPSIFSAEEFEYFEAHLDTLSPRGLTGAAMVTLRLAWLLRKLRADVVQYHLFPSIISGRLAAWIADVPLRFSMIPGTYYLEAPVLGQIESGTAWADTRVIATCERTRTLYLEAGVPASKVVVHFYGVDPKLFAPDSGAGRAVRSELGIPEGPPVIGLVAIFYPKVVDTSFTPGYLVGRDLKGHDVLARAIPAVLREFPDATFLFVGGPWGPGGEEQMAEIRALTHSLGVDPNVIFTGHRENVPAMLSALDIALQCSLCENLGGSIEALMMARPLIVTEVGGLVDSVKHEQTGLLVPPGDPAELAEAILRLLRDPSFAARLGAAGRAFMLEGFTLQVLAEGLDDLYARCIAEERLPVKPAAGRYRLPVSIARLLMLPFRVAPIIAAVLRISPRFRPRYWLAGVLRVLGSPFRLFLFALRRRRRTKGRAGSGPLRVAQIVASSSGCDWLIGISEGLRERGYEVCAILDKPDGNLSERLERAGIRTFRVPMTFARDRDRMRILAYLFGLPLSAIRMARVLRRERVDIAQSHIFAATIISRLACALSGTTRHVSMIPGPRHLEARMTRIVDCLTQPLDDLTIAGSHFTRDLYASMRIDHSTLRVVYYGADEVTFDPSTVDGRQARTELEISDSVPLVGLVAQFYPPTLGPQTPPHTRGIGLKGHETLLAAVPIILERFPDAVFLLIGGGFGDDGEAYRLRLLEETANGRSADAVRFLGFRGDVSSLLAAMDVSVQCSLTENLGGTIEALMMERAVVATRVGGMPESVVDGVTGLLVPASDPVALAMAVIRLLEHREEARAFGTAGRKRMLHAFTMKETVRQIATLYEELELPGSVKPG